MRPFPTEKLKPNELSGGHFLGKEAALHEIRFHYLERDIAKCLIEFKVGETNILTIKFNGLSYDQIKDAQVDYCISSQQIYLNALRYLSNNPEQKHKHFHCDEEVTLFFDPTLNQLNVLLTVSRIA